MLTYNIYMTWILNIYKWGLTCIMPQSHPTVGHVQFLASIQSFTHKVQHEQSIQFSVFAIFIVAASGHQVPGPAQLDTAAQLFLVNKIITLCMVMGMMTIAAQVSFIRTLNVWANDDDEWTLEPQSWQYDMCKIVRTVKFSFKKKKLPEIVLIKTFKLNHFIIHGKRGHHNPCKHNKYINFTF